MTLALVLLALLGSPMPQPWGNDLTKTSREIIVGMPYSGKSTLAERLTRTAYRVVWFSPETDYEKPGRLVVTMPQLKRYPDLLLDPHLRLVVRNPENADGKVLAANLASLIDLCRWAEDLVLVCDEVGDYREESERVLNKLFRRGRHKGIATVLVSQVPTDIPYKCRKIASRVWCFKQSHADELKELRQLYGDSFAATAASWEPFDLPAVWVA